MSRPRRCRSHPLCPPEGCMSNACPVWACEGQLPLGCSCADDSRDALCPVHGVSDFPRTTALPVDRADFLAALADDEARSE